MTDTILTKKVYFHLCSSTLLVFFFRIDGHIGCGFHMQRFDHPQVQQPRTRLVLFSGVVVTQVEKKKTMEEVKDEICLVASIIDRLLAANDSLRADQLAPLSKRLRVAAGRLTQGFQPTQSGLNYSFAARSADVADGVAGAARPPATKLPPAKSPPPRVPASQKEGKKSASAGSPQRHTKIFVSREVSQAMCCSLYNLLEGTARLLRASHAHIYVKRGDDVFSIANVSRKLVFPPRQLHHRCLGNANAEVLGSSIALNRHIHEAERKSSVLIFPVYSQNEVSGEPRVPIATLHVERKDFAFAPFDETDECMMYFASHFCGELMSRIPQLDLLEAYYDPSTQHIVAPFEPFSPVSLPPMSRLGASTFGGLDSQSPEEAEYAARALKQMRRKMNARNAEILVRRESLPAANSKPFAPGVTHMPSLLEIQAYVENLQSCWKKNLSENVDLLEQDRGTQQDLKTMRAELAATRRQLAAAADRLRLYELEASDYKAEYGAMKSELNAYMNGLERLH